MTTTRISQRAVAALAALVHEIQAQAGVTPWDEPGIAAAIRKTPDVPLQQLAVAFTRGCLDPANLTPAVLADLNNRAWDSDWHLPCKTHPQTRARRTDGECAGCYADRRADESSVMRDRGGRPIPDDARAQMLTAIGGTRA